MSCKLYNDSKKEGEPENAEKRKRKEEENPGFSLSAPKLPSGITKIESSEALRHLLSELCISSCLHSSCCKGFWEPLKMSLPVTFL